MIVAIDGPAGAGKSTVARAVAERLGFAHMDTGAMYRAVTIAVLAGDADPADPTTLGTVIAGIEMALDDPRVYLGGDDVTDRLRSPEVTDAVSSVAAEPAVRAALVPLQKQLADDHDVVVEGRDIGTVVFPTAEVKIYLTASPEQRARRRRLQLGLSTDDVAVAEEMRVRDAADASRSLSPLLQAEGAHRIDSTEMSFDEVTAAIVALVEQHRGPS